MVYEAFNSYVRKDMSNSKIVFDTNRKIYCDRLPDVYLQDCDSFVSTWCGDISRLRRDLERAGYRRVVCV